MVVRMMARTVILYDILEMLIRLTSTAILSLSLGRRRTAQLPRRRPRQRLSLRLTGLQQLQIKQGPFISHHLLSFVTCCDMYVVNIRNQCHMKLIDDRVDGKKRCRCYALLSGTVPERQTRGNTGRAFESLALWGFGGHLWILHQMQIIANLCPLQRVSSTSIAFQVNSDSTRTFGQAQSSLSDAVAEQLRQEIGSLRAKAAQVPCQSIWQ